MGLIFLRQKFMANTFDPLNNQEQVRRYRQMAHQALTNYPIRVQDLTCITMRHNIIFRVVAQEGHFALRIGYPLVRSRLMVQSEMQWLHDLSAADLSVVQPLRRKDGHWVTTLIDTDSPHERQIVLTKWQTGSLVNDHPTASKLKQMGIILAQLHRFAIDYYPAQPFMSSASINLDEWGNLSYIHDKTTATQAILLTQAIKRVTEHLQSWRRQEGVILIHADYHLKNALYDDEQITIIDFDDCRWGHPLQDWGVILDWLSDSTLVALRDAFFAGYASQSTIPYSEQDFTLAIAYRKLYALNFVYYLRPHAFAAVLAKTCDWLQTHIS